MVETGPMEEPQPRRTKDRGSDAIASISSIAGSIVIILIAVATLQMLRGDEDGVISGGTIFFLILGAVAVFFLTAMLVAGLAALVIRMSRWLDPSRARGEVEDAVSGKVPAADVGDGSADESERPS
jgi:NAD/NADP transhydrogenase alpha subunit